MKRILLITVALIMVLTLAACGGTTASKLGGDAIDPAPSAVSTVGSVAPEPSNAPEPSATVSYDLTQFTAVAVPDWEILEDWMIPAGGVLTKASEQMGMHFLTVSGITRAEVDSYEQVLVANGLTAHTGNVSTHIFDNDEVSVTLAIQAVEQTKESTLRITIEKP